MEQQRRMEEMELLRGEITMLTHRLEECQKQLIMYHDVSLNSCEGNILTRFWRLITTEPDW